MKGGGLCSLFNPQVPQLLSISIFHPKNHNPNPNRSTKCTKYEEIRVCTNKPCRKQGSMQTLEILSDIAPPHIAVNSCGCLGRCGAGPNLVLLPGAVFVRHVGTPSRAAEIIAAFSGGDGGGEMILEALALRKRAEVEVGNGGFSEALVLLTQAIGLKPCGGVHIMFKDRASAKLAMSDYLGALEDVQEALALAPQYSEAYTCQGDTFLAMGQLDAAEKSYSTALDINPTLRRSKSFKVRISKLEEKLIAANTLEEVQSH